MVSAVLQHASTFLPEVEGGDDERMGDEELEECVCVCVCVCVSLAEDVQQQKLKDHPRIATDPPHGIGRAQIHSPLPHLKMSSHRSQ